MTEAGADHADGAGQHLYHDALLPGTRVGRYNIESVLGQGGFGITYRAYDSELGREVALKEYMPAATAIRTGEGTLHPRSTRTASDFIAGRDRFIAEGRTLASLERLPGIVRVYDLVQAHGTAYIVMELLAGGTLNDRLAREGTLRQDEAKALLAPLMAGLSKVHATGFLHRDIKPANILLDGEGGPILADFGAARATATLITGATAIFTPGYAATEQFTEGAQGPWTDIYGLAATLHHAITGQPPPNSFDRIVEDTYVPLVQRRLTDYPPSFLAGIDAGLALRAKDRPQSIEAWHACFVPAGTEVTKVMPKTVAPFAEPTRTPKSRRFRRLAAASAGVVALALAALLLAQIFGSSRAPGPRLADSESSAGARIEVPFIRASCMTDCIKPFLTGADFKALAIDPRGFLGYAVGEANEESAGRTAMTRCVNDVRENVASAPRCELFAVGDRVVWPYPAPPMPPAPYVPLVRSDPPERLDPAKIPFLSDAVRTEMGDRYRQKPSPKALVLGKGSRQWSFGSQDSEIDAARVFLQRCGFVTKRQCVVVALNNAAVVRLPELHHMTEILTPEDLPTPQDGQKEGLRHYFIANDWRAIAVGTNNRMGFAAGLPSEVQAARAAVVDCASSGGVDCAVRAIGPFLVEGAK
jgi:serine/threonine protein kinase